TIVIGRDGRMSGSMILQLVIQSLRMCGVNVIDCDLSTTPTIEYMVIKNKADGGIIITASHNPRQWNALKLLNSDGEFLNENDGAFILQESKKEHFTFATIDQIGTYTQLNTAIEEHIAAILKYPLVDVEAIKKKNFKVVVDVINSTGSIAIPLLFEALGIKEFELVCGDLNGNFEHNPEPLPQHLTKLSKLVKKKKADFGIAVDPDVDRLCFIDEHGNMFGEEYTLVAVSDYFLKYKKGNTVSNICSTKALKDITEKSGCQYFAAAVGEVNVVQKMKEVNAIIGGEGNGGVIVPDFHYGRDALIGIALFLSYLLKIGLTVSELRKSYPDYYISKNKIDLPKKSNINELLDKVEKEYVDFPCSRVDGVRIDMPDGFVSFRASNTEPIIRIYTEALEKEKAEAYAQHAIQKIEQYL
ncbi:MAG: phosphoglucosamine mutase, partial [Chitinophagaceae bacterium]